MDIEQFGYSDYYFEKYDETISVSRPKILVYNIIMGSTYIDVDGEMESINHQTKEKIELKFATRGWSTISTLTGQVFNEFGEETHTISGSWLEKIKLTNSQTGEEEIIWDE